jgi:hypothetical protein
MLETAKLVVTVFSAIAGAWLAVDHRLDSIEVQLATIQTRLTYSQGK